MTVKLFNTLTRTVDEVQPITDKKIGIYTCGLTVYSQPHIGNWVSYIYWDILIRTLRASGYDVTRVQNITDVGHLTSDEDAGEDKMLKGALREGITAWQVADKYAAIADDEAYNLLGLIRPDHMPRATDYIPQQIQFVQELEAKGYTYTIADGVYFDTSKLDNYGELARLDIDGLEFGARVADSGKKNPTDFALWKFSSPDEKRDMEWSSPWGTGFPGWHLECSVMARELLGDQIDIHTGGIDHIPIHHTNEIAQTEAVTGKRFSNIWLHANHIKVDGTKMSKSLGNIYTLQDITDKGYDLRAFKLLVLSKHYQTEGNFTWEILEAAQNRLNHWLAVADMRWQGAGDGDVTTGICEALQNDLDTPAALAKVDELLSGDRPVGLKHIVDEIDTLLGIDLKRPDINNEQKSLISERETARQSKDWARSDEIRDQLLSEGIVIRDTSAGSIWELVN
jgi:cysteinyl-tRNA synthetase